MPDVLVFPLTLSCSASRGCILDNAVAAQDMPKAHLLEPWKASKAVQMKANCVISKDYPAPICDHTTVHKENILRWVCRRECEMCSSSWH